MKLFAKEVKRFTFEDTDFTVTFRRLTGKESLEFERAVQRVNTMQEQSEKAASSIELYLELLGKVTENLVGFSDLDSWPSTEKERERIYDVAGLDFMMKVFSVYNDSKEVTDTTKGKSTDM